MRVPKQRRPAGVHPGGQSSWPSSPSRSRSPQSSPRRSTRPTAAATGDQGRRHRRPGRVEHRELHQERQAVRGPGPLLRRHRGRDLQPERDVDPGQGRGPGREGRDLPRSRQRVAQSVRRLLAVLRRTASGSTRRRATATPTRSITASTTSGPASSWPRTPSSSSTACATPRATPSGARPTRPRPSPSSASTTSGRASCEPAPGRSSPTGSPTRRTSCTGCSRRTGRSARSSPARRAGSARTTSSSDRSRTPGYTAWMAPKVARSLLPIGGRQPGSHGGDIPRQLTRTAASI